MNSSETTPQHLLRNGRPEDQAFDASELLYRRLPAGTDVSNGIEGECIGFSKNAQTGEIGCSLNRAKYSVPRDAFRPFDRHEKMGLAKFESGSVVPDVIDEGNNTFTFMVVHDPQDDNYSHSEIRAYRSDNLDKSVEPSRTARRVFRQKMAEKLSLCITPGRFDPNKEGCEDCGSNETSSPEFEGGTTLSDTTGS